MSIEYRAPKGQGVSRGYFDALTKEGRVNPTVNCTVEEDLAVQYEKDSCDINKIVASHVRLYGGVQAPPPQVFADVSQGWDYREVLEKAREAEEYFMSLDSAMRLKYGNDPGRFLEEIWAAENLEDAKKIGLVSEAEPPVTPGVPDEVPANPPA